MTKFDQRLQKAVKDGFPGFEGDIDDSLSPDQVETWDSMGHLNLIMRIQEEFSVELDFLEIMSIETVGDIRKILQDKGIQ